MARKYVELQATMPPDRRARAQARAETILRDMPLTSDLARIDAMTDADIDYRDIPDMSDEARWPNAVTTWPPTKQLASKLRPRRPATRVRDRKRR